MGRTFIRQDIQIRNSDVYDDTITPSEANFETNPTHIEQDLNNIRSQLKTLMGVTNWYDVVTRDVESLNTDLADIEGKRLICSNQILTNVAIGTPGDQYVVLSQASSETPTLTAAVGAGTALGAIVAELAGDVGTAALTEVAGANALSPKNLVLIRDATTKEAIISSNGREIFGLLQVENGVVDGDSFDDTTHQVQISFVENNGSDDLALITAGDMNGKSFEYLYPHRISLDTLVEDCSWPPQFSDQVASTDVTRQNAYDFQGTTPVELSNNADLDLAAAVEWAIRDAANADLFNLTEGSGGGTSTLTIGSDVDVYQNDAADVDFAQGITVDEGGTALNLGVTAGQIDSAAGLSILSVAADLSLASGLELNLTDSYRAGSTWSLADGVALANSSAEWSNFETAFGEVSLLAAIYQAYSSSAVTKVYAEVTAATINEDTDVSGPSNDNNIDADLGDLSLGTFLQDYDVYVNGELQEPGVDAAANNDYYPGTSLANGQLKFEFKLKQDDKIAVIKRA